MNFHVLTLFPEMIEQGLSESITGRALKQNIISLDTVNIRDFANNKHNKVERLYIWWRRWYAYAGRTCIWCDKKRYR